MFHNYSDCSVIPRFDGRPDYQCNVLPSDKQRQTHFLQSQSQRANVVQGSNDSTVTMEAGLNDSRRQPTNSDEQYAVMSQLECQIKQLNDQIEDLRRSHNLDLPTSRPRQCDRKALMENRAVSSQDAQLGARSKHGDVEKRQTRRTDDADSSHAVAYLQHRMPKTGKADTFRYGDREVSMKCGNSRRRRNLSEDSNETDSSDDDGDRRPHGLESTGDIRHDVVNSGNVLVIKLSGLNRKSLMDMEVLKHFWFSLRIVLHTTGGLRPIK